MSYLSPPAAGTDMAALRAPRLAWAQRLMVIAAGSALLALLATAACLTPSPRGMGTHQQLGLPPCTIVQWYGLRCPSCGMTTSWAHLVRGQPLAAWRASAGGTLLGLAACLVGPWLVACGLWGWWLIGPPQEGLTLAAGLTIVAVTIIDWTLKLSLGW
jgi:hypothetical protein